MRGFRQPLKTKYMTAEQTLLVSSTYEMVVDLSWARTRRPGPNRECYRVEIRGDQGWSRSGFHVIFHFSIKSCIIHLISLTFRYAVHFVHLDFFMVDIPSRQEMICYLFYKVVDFIFLCIPFKVWPIQFKLTTLLITKRLILCIRVPNTFLVF